MKTKIALLSLGVALLIASGYALAAPATPASAPALSSAPADRPAPTDHRISPGEAAILGVVEGITEYLPVSSTGHLILAGYFMDLVKLSDEPGPLGPKIVKSDAIDAFDIVIQLGAILAVVGLYRKRVEQMGLGVIGRDPAGRKLVILLLIAFLPAAIVGLVAHKAIKAYLFSPYPVTAALIVGGVLMIVVEHFFWTKRKDRPRTSIDAMTYAQALFIGLAQVLAMWPGTSRSMITMLAALVVGLDMIAAAEFSFLLALPTLGAATLYEGYKSRHELFQAAGLDGLLIGLFVSAIVAAVAVAAFVKWLTRHGMMPFGIYRIVLGIVLILIFAKAI